MQSPSIGGSPGPSAEAAVVASAQTEASPAIEPSPIPDLASKQGKAKAGTTLALATPVATAGSEALAGLGNAAPPAGATSIAAGSPSMPSDIPAMAVPSLSPTVETPAQQFACPLVIASAG
jgi:hypothetical protein